MRIVVSGGMGLIGRPLVTGLAADGHQVVVLSRNPQRHQSVLPEGVTVEGWDGTTLGDWAQSVDGAGAVINFAGEGLAGDNFFRPVDRPEKRDIRDSRLNAGRVVVQAIEAAANKPAVLVQASAVGYYGPRGDEPIAESAPVGDDYLAKVCVDWEASTAAVQTMGVRRVVARTGLVLTAEGGPLSRLALLHKFYVGGPFGNGRQWWSWIHLDDEVRAIRFLMETAAASGPFNLTAPNPLTNRELGKALGRAMGKPSYMPAPAFAMRLLVGEVATIVLDGQRAIPAKLEELGFTFRFTDAEEALRDAISGLPAHR